VVLFSGGLVLVMVVRDQDGVKGKGVVDNE